MAKYCAVCGGKASSGYTCFTGGVSYCYNPAYVPLMDISNKNEGWFCNKCAIAIGQVRGHLSVTYNGSIPGYPCPEDKSAGQIPGQRQEGLNYLGQYITKIRNPLIQQNIVNYMNESVAILKKYSLFDNLKIEVSNKINQELGKYDKSKMINVGYSSCWLENNIFYYTKYGLGFLSSLDKPFVDYTYQGNNRLKAVDTFQKEILDTENTIVTIHADKIIFFQEKGDIQYSTSVTGGGGSGGGVNASGAFIGGLLFGDVGAILGSRAGTELHINPIQSQTQEHDNRYVVLRYKGTSGNIIEEKFAYHYYDKVFMKLIPEKEYSHVNIQREQKPQNTEEPLMKIKQLKELLDMGAITQEEFDAKKKQFLGL